MVVSFVLQSTELSLKSIVENQSIAKLNLNNNFLHNSAKDTDLLDPQCSDQKKYINNYVTEQKSVNLRRNG